jgi:manganese/zinc/iron transport system ATP- binding protein
VTDPFIHFDRVALGYGHRVVLHDVDLDVPSGDFLGIVGPNGAGKTTLLKALLGTLRPLRGSIQIPPQGVAFGYVPQRQAVDETFPLTVREMIAMGRFARIGLLGRPGSGDRALVVESAQHVGIADLLDRRYRTLSGGQKQRTLIARALAAEPTVLVLDEPTNGMDLPAEHAIMELVRRLHEEDGLTVVMVSHLLNVVASYVARLAIVGHGRLEVGPIDAMLTAERLTRLYQTAVRVHHVDGSAVVLPGGAR